MIAQLLCSRSLLSDAFTHLTKLICGVYQSSTQAWILFDRSHILTESAKRMII